MRVPLAVASLSLSIAACSATPEGAAIEPPSGGRACSLVGCTSGVTWAVHLPTAVTYGAADAYTLTVCREADCATAKPIPIDAANASGSTFRAWVSFEALERGIVYVDVDVAGHGVDGESYGLFVAGPNGVDVVGLERRAILGDPYYPNGRECDEPQGYWCRRAHFDVWSDSGSDLTCTGNPVVGGVRMRVGSTFEASQWAYASLAVCRGELCAGTKFDAFPCYPGAALLEAGIGAQVVWDCEGHTISDVVITTDEDPTRLANGDRYRVVLTNPTGTKAFYDAEAVATYDESFPNGPVCDAHPSRTAELTLP